MNNQTLKALFLGAVLSNFSTAMDENVNSEGIIGSASTSPLKREEKFDPENATVETIGREIKRREEKNKQCVRPFKTANELRIIDLETLLRNHKLKKMDKPIDPTHIENFQKSRSNYKKLKERYRRLMDAISESDIDQIIYSMTYGPASNTKNDDIVKVVVRMGLTSPEHPFATKLAILKEIFDKDAKIKKELQESASLSEQNFLPLPHQEPANGGMNFPQFGDENDDELQAALLQSYQWFSSYNENVINSTGNTGESAMDQSQKEAQNN